MKILITVSSEKKFGCLEQAGETLDEVSPEDEDMIFKQMIRDVVMTHRELTPAHKEAYEQLLRGVIRTGKDLADPTSTSETEPRPRVAEMKIAEKELKRFIKEVLNEGIF